MIKFLTGATMGLLIFALVVAAGICIANLLIFVVYVFGQYTPFVMTAAFVAVMGGILNVMNND